MDHDTESCIRVMGIDPGSKTLGIAFMDYYPDLNTLAFEAGWTFSSQRAVLLDPARCIEFGTLHVRFEAIGRHLVETLSSYRPDVVVAETSYMSKHAHAFSVLTQCFSTIQRALSEYSSSMVLQKIDPARAKTAVGVPGNSGDKELVKKAMMGLRMENRTGIPLAQMSEHTLDAALIAHYQAKQLGFKAISP